MATAVTPQHPAKFSDAILAKIREVLDERLPKGTVLDPFGGTGRVHELMTRDRWTWAVELEPEWACGWHMNTCQGDATDLGYDDGEFDAVVTSPPYGNRMADSYAGDGTRRHTYRIALGRELTEGSAAGLQWGDEYRATMTKALNEIWRVLKPGGLFVLNISDHIRKGEPQYVPSWYMGKCVEIGFHFEQDHRVETPRNRHGANSDARVDCEHVIVWTKP